MATGETVRGDGREPTLRRELRFGEAIEPGLPREEVEERVLHAINALNPQS